MSAAEVFECEGAFAFLEAPQRFTFRVFPDSSMSIGIAPLHSDREESSDDHSAVGVVMEDDDEVDAATAAGEAAEQYQDDEDQDDGDEDVVATETKVFAFDGRALPGRSEQERDGEKAVAEQACYIVHFKLVRWCRDPYSTQFIKCVGRLSSKTGLTGKCIDLENAIDEDAEGDDFALRLVQDTRGYYVEPVSNPLSPLTPGVYVLSGHTIGENGYVYECEVQLKLKSDGMAVGASRELLFPQECAVAGAWSRFDLNYLLQYQVDDNRCTYMYFGAPHADSLRGSWQNSDLVAFRNRAERGCLEFRLVSARRIWSPSFHKDYPPQFRECVKLLLLAAHRARKGSAWALPGHLMLQVVSYFAYDWFRQGAVTEGGAQA